ncbi:Methyl-accepting chemotaxis protein I (serine chemoreceptor protein) [hydrothermal vent metagenome]|uniref:Methyl-accepting chemotaxis protein I (Serine chemoreceptor protein) n=1 Tax=hydrothermal vent metagenome TaxID=652676 RepID=A0A3B0QUI5_9ZZZZ
MKFGIKGKLGLIMGSFVVLILATIAATFWTVSAQKSDGTVMNMAGRQRMLSQKMSKEVMALLQGKAEARQVLDTVGLFDKSLTALISGDAEMGIPMTKEPKIQAQLGKVKGQWMNFKASLTELAKNADKRAELYAYVSGRNEELLREMNKAVALIDKAGFNARTLNLAGRQRMLSQKMTKEVMALDNGVGSAEQTLATVALFDKTLNGLLRGDKELGLTPVRKPLITAQLRKVEGLWRPFKKNIEGLIEQIGAIEKNRSYVLANNVPLLKEMNKGVGMYEAASAGKVTTLKETQIGFLAVTIVVFVIAWIVLARIIIRPVQEVSFLATSIADGNLTEDDVKVRSNDEIGSLAETVNAMKSNLNDMMQKIRSGAKRVSGSSEELAQSNTDFSQRITEQSGSIEETAATIEEISAGVNQNADTCRETNKVATDCRNKAEEGGTVMHSMMTSIEDINNSSKEIADIINVIEEIAFQTNLLALNAAVEAARAGEQGKGFAVVAVEVRNLAHRSSKAAKEITGLIKENLEKARGGTQYAQMTQANLEEIIESVKKVSDQVAEISAASSEQAVGVDQVNKAISQLDQVTQQNATMLEQSTTTGEQMNAESSRLLELVGHFRLRTGKSGGGKAKQAKGKTAATGKAAAADAQTPAQGKAGEPQGGSSWVDEQDQKAV